MECELCWLFDVVLVLCGDLDMILVKVLKKLLVECYVNVE